MMILLAVLTLVATAAAAETARRIFRPTGAHAAPRSVVHDQAGDWAQTRVVPRRATRSQPPADLFPPLAPPLEPLPAEPARTGPSLPEPAEARWIWDGGPDTGTWQVVDPAQLLEGIAA